MKSVYIESLGCAKNQVDSEVLYGYLSNEYKLVKDASKASLIIVNTCGFIESAKEESINVFFKLKNSYPNAKIILAGCLAQRYFNELTEQLKEADAVFGNRDLSKIKDVVNDLKSLNPGYSAPTNEIRKYLMNYPGSAYVKISEGCNHRCSFCAIPNIRGSLRSKNLSDVLKEVESLVKTGVKEINLIAQDLCSYGLDLKTDINVGFIDLLEYLNEMRLNFKIRLLYLHPDYITPELIKTIKKCDKVLHYFDIPFQHCNEELLKKMGRKGNFNQYLDMVTMIKEEIPDAVIRTTLMLGFPSDNENCFNELIEFIEKCHFTWMGSFLYSREENTKAYEMIDENEYKILNKESKKWKNKLEKIQKKITEKELKNFIDKTYPVIIEEKIKNEDLYIGRMYAQAPEVDGLTVVSGENLKCGEVYMCHITGISGIDLKAIKI